MTLKHGRCPTCVRLSSACTLLAALVASSGCAPKDQPSPEVKAQTAMTRYQTEIPKIVPDRARADQLIALTTQFRELTDKAANQLRADTARMAELNSNYTATRADYEALFTRQHEERNGYVRQALAIREKIAGLLTDEEWAQLRKARVESLDANLKALNL